MTVNVNWTFSTKWVDDDHILLEFTNGDKDHNILLTTVEYVHFMELQQYFAMTFKAKIDNNIIDSYTNG
jgi:hypothetical protein